MLDNAGLKRYFDLLHKNQKMNTSESRPAPFWRSWGIVWMVALAAMLPLLAVYLLGLWRYEHYRYFPFALLLSGYLVWDRWDRRVVAPSGVLAWLAIAGSLFMLVAGGVLYSPWLAAMAFVLLTGVCLFSHRARSGERLILAWLPLLMLLRLPLNYDQQIVVGLQNLTTKVSSYLLDALAVSHKTLGNIIQMPDRELLVADACSGIQSAFTLCFIAVAIVAWKRRPLVIVPLALCFALLWALTANVVRVTSIAVAASGDLDLSTGWAHEALGYAVLIAAAGLVLSTDHFLRIGCHPMALMDDLEDENPLVYAWGWVLGETITDNDFGSTGGAVPSSGEQSLTGEDTGSAQAIQNQAPHSSPRLVLAAGVIVFLALSANLPLLFRGTLGDVKPPANEEALFFAPESTLFDDVAEDARFVNHRAVRDGDDPRLGTHADLWTVQHPHFRGELILSQPYNCWHDFSVCYKNLDWIETNRYSARAGKTSVDVDEIAVNTFQNREGLHGYLLYTAFRESGDVIAPPSKTILGATIQRTKDLVKGAASPLREFENHAMLQLWIVTEGELNASSLTDAIDTLGSVRDRLAQSIQEGQSER